MDGQQNERKYQNKSEIISTIKKNSFIKIKSY